MLYNLLFAPEGLFFLKSQHLTLYRPRTISLYSHSLKGKKCLQLETPSLFC